MKLKLFKKYFLATALIIIFSLSIMMVILTFVFNDYVAQTQQSTLTKACDEVSEYLNSKSENPNFRDVKDFFGLLNTISNVSDIDVFIANPSTGEVLVCGCDEYYSDNRCMHTTSLINTEDIENGEKVNLSTLNMYSKPHYVAQKAIGNSGLKGVSVFATAPVTVVRELMTSVTKLYAISAILPIIIMFFCIYAMTYRLTKPLKLMSEASRAMAKGDFSRRIPVTSDDEIGELAASFNMMTNSLAQLEGMRKSFVANVSHELKTPMTTIGGFIDGILDGTIEQDKQSYYLNIVSDEVKRLSRLVQSMLSMSRLESGDFVLKPELFDLRELLFTIAVGQEQRIEEKKLQIIGLDELQSVSVKADKDLIYQAVYNLVDNAIKFSEDNGNITFALKNENKMTTLSVTNTGKGIPEKDLPFVFERFYKVDKSRSASKNSTGLGLYIVKTIITAHGGKVVVTSKEDQFTSFKVILPTGQ